MRYFFFALSILAVCMSCGGGDGGPSPEELASLAAKGYYQHLVDGEYQAYLEGKDGMDAAPEAYRQQLQQACSQYVSELQQAHQGVRELAVSSVCADTVSHSANVFLVLSFGDGTTEEVVVPMVEHDGKWRMR